MTPTEKESGTRTTKARPMGRETCVKLTLTISPALAFAFYVVSRTVGNRLEAASQGTADLALLAKSSMGIAGLLVSIVLIAAIRGGYKGFARFALLYNLSLMGALLVLTETLLPVPRPPTQAQKLMIEQLRRRHEELKTPYHGSLFVPGRANELGWLDRNHSFVRQSRRILFIGDSMLEVRSLRRLALRVEDRFAADPIEVVNLSMTGSDPKDYRFRLNEYAFDYQPEHIFIFLYGPNDFELTPPYEPYRPRPVRVTRQTIESARSVGLPSEIMDRLSQLAREGRVYPDRKSFFAAIGGHRSQTQNHLLYTVAVAHSDADTRQSFDSTCSRLQVLGTKLVDLGSKVLARMGRPVPIFPDPLWWGRESFHEREKAVYRLPRQQRLGALAHLYAECMHFPAGPVHQLLLQQTPELQSWLTAEPDVLWFLAVPLNRLSGLEITPGPEDDGLRRFNADRVAMYVRLLREMSETAKAHHCKLTFVFIPTPGLADRDFVQFWKGHPPTEWSAKSYQQVLAKVKDRVSVLDLGAEPDRFRGAYWPLDGHWTDTGNNLAADILAKFLKTNPYSALRQTTP